ncbi:hypothetical protein PtrM4_122280 [Pyrenophora tritici-repentis]|nr:hypothetical protein PtrM4_122280 [Pyrenophora tritici-repentis]KAI1668738.1 hypothetical protein L13192_07874 [Pyrenophora tritici-repentis]KAI1680438.1 hypothetical protein KJE20_09289 [Pyrenophora tritici-repentis]
MRSEIGLLPYKLNTFRVTFQTLGFFVSKLPQAIKKVITSIVINIDGRLLSSQKEQLEELRMFTALETIIIEFDGLQRSMEIRAVIIGDWIKNITGKDDVLSIW